MGNSGCCAQHQHTLDVEETKKERSASQTRNTTRKSIRESVKKKEVQLNLIYRSVTSDYKLKSKIGTTRFGVVKLAHSKRNPNRFVIIKYLNKEKLDKVSAEVKQELLLLSQVENKNICRVLKVYYFEDTFQVVTEYMPPTSGYISLRTFVETNKPNEYQIAVITEKLLMIVNTLVKMKICYRDVKLQNLVIDPDTLEVKLRDIGLSTFYPSVSELRESLIQPFHLSPEAIKGGFKYGCECWSIGVIVYFMFKQEFPYPGLTREGIFHNIVALNSDLFNKAWLYSHESRQFLKGMLENVLARRFTIKRALRDNFIVGKDMFKQQEELHEGESEFVERTQAMLGKSISEANILKECMQTSEQFNEQDLISQKTNEILQEEMLKVTPEFAVKDESDENLTNLESSSQSSLDFFSVKLEAKKSCPVFAKNSEPQFNENSPTKSFANSADREHIELLNQL